jgi:AcrR family transcriptional regulator
VSTTVKAAPVGASPRQVEKFERRRTELADAALVTLAELGYARTSLRDIAQNSDFSHGVLHYYFHDKIDLITACARRYKTSCLTGADAILARCRTPKELSDGLADAFRTSLVDDGRVHRLWYDLRAQALYEPNLRADVAEINRSLEKMISGVVTRLADLRGVVLPVPAVYFYASLDGLFQQALMRHLSGDPVAGSDLRRAVLRVLARIGPVPGPGPDAAA